MRSVRENQVHISRNLRPKLSKSIASESTKGVETRYS